MAAAWELLVLVVALEHPAWVDLVVEVHQVVVVALVLLALLVAVQELQVLVVDQAEELQVWVDPEVMERLALAAEHLVLLVLVVGLLVEHLA